MVGSWAMLWYSLTKSSPSGKLLSMTPPQTIDGGLPSSTPLSPRTLPSAPSPTTASPRCTPSCRSPSPPPPSRCCRPYPGPPRGLGPSEPSLLLNQLLRYLNGLGR